MNKVVVISGASSGIGLALKSKFLNDGDFVIGLSRTVLDENDIACDVSSPEDIKKASLIIKEKYGKVDILVNNAGIGISGATELIPMENIRRAFEISYFGALGLTRAILPLMDTGSRIIFMSSISGLTAIPFRSVYCSVKAAELMLGESLRMELSETGIKVVTFCPGEIKTNFSSNKLADIQTSARYGERVKNALEVVASREKKRMKMDKVINSIYKKCIKGRKAMYIIGAKYKFLYFAKRIMPTTAYLNLTNNMLGGKKK